MRGNYINQSNTISDEFIKNYQIYHDRDKKRFKYK